MQKLKLDTNSLKKGLLTICFGTFCGLTLFAQAPGVVRDATNTAKQPFKEVQGVIKEGTQPIKDVNRTIKDVEKAPKDVTNEVKRTGKEFERAEKEIEKTEKSVEKVTGSGNKNDDKKAEEDKKASDDGKGADGKTAASTGQGNGSQSSNDAGSEASKEQTTRKSEIPPDYVPQPKTAETQKNNTEPEKKGELPFYSRDNKTPSGPWPKSELSNKAIASGGTELPDNANVAADGKNAKPIAETEAKTVESQPEVEAEVTETETVEVSIGEQERFVNLDPEVQKPREKRPKPDYSGSPARIALEKAEFELETLEDLFQYSNWEGPEREHTVRAVGYALDDLQNAISEVKRLDPAHPTYRFENRYKEMRAAYVNEVRSQQ